MADNYFGAIVDLSNKFKALDINVLINTILSQPESIEFMIKLNTKGLPTSQLFELNVDSEGVQLSSIGGDYSDFTLKNSATPKKSKSAINLEDEGDYYRSKKILFPSLSTDYFIMTSDPQKDDNNLEDRWGKHLDGFTDKNMEIIQEKIILPQLANLILKITGL